MYSLNRKLANKKYYSTQKGIESRKLAKKTFRLTEHGKIKHREEEKKRRSNPDIKLKKRLQNKNYRENNMEKVKNYNKEYHANPEKIVRRRELHYTKTYGITIETYNALFDSQHGVCKICGRTGKKRLSVDHNHSTGKVRGLLCMRCNLAIGLLDENHDILDKVKQYLQSYA